MIVAMFLSLVTLAHADRVLDLGKMESQGKFRGPEVQWTDSGLIDGKPQDVILWSQLKKLEEELLREGREQRKRE